MYHKTQNTRFRRIEVQFFYKEVIFAWYASNGSHKGQQSRT